MSDLVLTQARSAISHNLVAFQVLNDTAISRKGFFPPGLPSGVNIGCLGGFEILIAIQKEALGIGTLNIMLLLY